MKCTYMEDNGVINRIAATNVARMKKGIIGYLKKNNLSLIFIECNGAIYRTAPMLD